MILYKIVKIEENYIFVYGILKYWKINIFSNEIYVTWISVYPQSHIPLLSRLILKDFRSNRNKI